MFDAENLLMVLLVIRSNKSPYNLHEKGKMGYYEIGLICNYAIEHGWAIIVNDSIRITKEGKKKIDELTKTLEYKGINRFVLPLNKYLVQKMSKDQVYIPKKFR